MAASGIVSVNPPDDGPKWPNAYFRSVNHVSLCDLRSLADDELDLGLERYFFLNPRRDSSGPVFLFLRGASLERIVPYREATDTANRLGKLIVPYIEAGYPGDLPLTAISEVLLVDVKKCPFNHPFLGGSYPMEGGEVSS